MTPFVPSFARYLAAKKSVDDRALNAHVWHTLVAKLDALSDPPNVLEVGAGIGTMVERLLEWSALAEAQYHAIDAQPENVRMAHARLHSWADRNGFAVGVHGNNTLHLSHAGREQALRLQLETGDALALADRADRAETYDLLIGHAFLDLIDLPTGLPRLLRPVRVGGLIYATINFDGATIFEPTIDPGLDAQIEALYHRTMDERMTDGRPSGDSRTGRHLFGRLAAAGVDVLAAGSSDWVVHALDGRYPADEAYFLHFIIDTVNGALRDHPALDSVAFAAWVESRHRQVERGELVYIAHQLDFVGVKRGPDADVRGNELEN